MIYGNRTCLFVLLLGTVFSKVQAQDEEWNLRRCIEHALTENINVKQQEIVVENQRNALSTAKNSRLPNLSASANQSFNFGRGLTMDNTYANRNTQSTSFDLSTNVPVFTGGQIGNEIRMRRLNLMATVADLEKTRESISIQITSLYLEALYQKALLEVAYRQQELSRAQRDKIRALYDNGKRSESELAEAEATVANDGLSVTLQENAVRLALLDLSQLLELPSPEGFDIVQPDDTSDNSGISSLVLASPDDIYAEASLSKPQIMAETYRLESAEKNILVARSGLYPSIHFGAGLGSNYYKTSGFAAPSFGSQMRDNFNKYIGISLSVPIFNRFATRNNIRAARLQYRSQQLQLEDARKTLYKEIQQAYYNAIAAQRQCVSSQTAENASHSSFVLMSRKYENGKANATEYQESKTKYMKSVSERLQAKYTFIFRSKILNFYRGNPLY
ncbi:MAG: TolC family protein [Bacteroides sp.]|nr:TolC family protein [Roseburia sp.]MCM1347566.1 TolC family protein [Bacteroides sp.]MCM1421200.1 TolC family protein [Bacteroides sp.]